MYLKAQKKKKKKKRKENSDRLIAQCQLQAPIAVHGSSLLIPSNQFPSGDAVPRRTGSGLAHHWCGGEIRLTAEGTQRYKLTGMKNLSALNNNIRLWEVQELSRLPNGYHHSSGLHASCPGPRAYRIPRHRRSRFAR